MAVKMRLMRMGKTKSPYYRVVVIDGRSPRDGRYLDLIGRYDPRQDPSVIDIDNEKAIDWLRKGAQPTEAVSKILDAAGALTQFKVKSGKIHTVGGAAAAAKVSTVATSAESAVEAEEGAVSEVEEVEIEEVETVETVPPVAAADGVEPEAIDTTDEPSATDSEEE
jgi:small subunit ribosomal protein S16